MSAASCSLESASLSRSSASAAAAPEPLRPDIRKLCIIGHGVGLFLALVGGFGLLARLGNEAEDGIDALLGQSLAYERTEVPGLTGFLEWLSSEDLEIKFRRKKGLPLISGIEVFSDEKQVGSNSTADDDQVAG